MERSLKSEIENAKNEFQRKIGRNVLAFQKLEQMLKYTIINGNVSGCISGIESKQKRRMENIRGQTMGQLVGQFVDHIHSGNEKSSEEPEDLKEPYISFNFQVEGGEDFYENKKQALKSLFNERNELVHHLLPGFDWNSMESCQDTERYLDQQYEKLSVEFNHLKAMIESFQEAMKLYSEFLNSDKGQKYFEEFWREFDYNRFVQLLIDIANKAARSDAWTDLSVAGDLVRHEQSEEMSALKQRYDHKTLKDVILATGQFDIKEEQTKKGGVRMLYRLKDERR